MNYFTRIAVLLTFSLLLLFGCSSQRSSHARYKPSVKRHHRSCGCYIPQSNHTDFALNTSVNGK